eukprot:scaffold6512_cov132-Isochrysis_galbana.AAC.4
METDRAAVAAWPVRRCEAAPTHHHLRPSQRTARRTRASSRPRSGRRRLLFLVDKKTTNLGTSLLWLDRALALDGNDKTPTQGYG